ncbi:MAG: hypothetical protein Q9203_003067 [Teloschistes exilis]
MGSQENEEHERPSKTSKPSGERSVKADSTKAMTAAVGANSGTEGRKSDAPAGAK